MEKLKAHWEIILICIFALFSMNRCTVACNRSNKIDKLDKEIVEIGYKNDSTLKSYQKHIDSLEVILKVASERENGLRQSLEIKNDAMRQISESKKNIQVTVKQEQNQEN